jgi:hypothetical protein
MGGGPVNSRHEDFLRDEMRQALDSRHPDRTAMLNRIAANRAAGPKPRGRVARLAGAALAVATVLGIGGVGKWALADSPGQTPAAPPPATAPATPVPSVVATATAPASREVTSHPRTQAPTPATSAPAPSASPVRGHPGDTQVEKGSLWSDGSIEDSGDSVVTLRAGADLTELDLTVRVTLTPGLTSLGVESSSDAVTATVTKQADALLYRFTLRSGARLTAGEYKVTAKWGGGERDAAGDTYEAYATSVERKRIHVYGNFVPKD